MSNCGHLVFRTQAAKLIKVCGKPKKSGSAAGRFFWSGGRFFKYRCTFSGLRFGAAKSDDSVKCKEIAVFFQAGMQDDLRDSGGRGPARIFFCRFLDPRIDFRLVLESIQVNIAEDQAAGSANGLRLRLEIPSIESPSSAWLLLDRIIPVVLF